MRGDKNKSTEGEEEGDKFGQENTLVNVYVDFVVFTRIAGTS